MTGPSYYGSYFKPEDSYFKPEDSYFKPEDSYFSSGNRDYAPRQAENGDFRGVDNDWDGLAELIYVRSYRKRNGTYVRAHYRH